MIISPRDTNVPNPGEFSHIVSNPTLDVHTVQVHNPNPVPIEPIPPRPPPASYYRIPAPSRPLLGIVGFEYLYIVRKLTETSNILV